MDSHPDSRSTSEMKEEQPSSSTREEDEAEPNAIQDYSSIHNQHQQSSFLLDSMSPNEPQGVMQMLSLVGSHFLEADRLGLTEVDPETDGDAQAETQLDVQESLLSQGEESVEQDSELLERSRLSSNEMGEVEEQAQMQQEAPAIPKGKAIPITSQDHRTRTLADMIDDQGEYR